MYAVLKISILLFLHYTSIFFWREVVKYCSKVYFDVCGSLGCISGLCEVIHYLRTENFFEKLRTCAYQGVRNVCFSESFAYVLNGWSVVRIMDNISQSDFFNAWHWSLPIAYPLNASEMLWFSDASSGQVFRCFQGVSKESSDIKYVNENINPFVPNASFIYSLKTSQTRKVFWYFHWLKKGCIGSECVDIEFHVHSQTVANTSNNYFGCKEQNLSQFLVHSLLLEFHKFTYFDLFFVAPF